MNENQPINESPQEAPQMVPAVQPANSNPLPWLIRSLIRRREGEGATSDRASQPPNQAAADSIVALHRRRGTSASSKLELGVTTIDEARARLLTVRDSTGSNGQAT